MPSVDESVDQIAAEFTQGHPNWIRMVVWVGRLAERDGAPAGADTSVDQVLSWDGDQVVADYASGQGAHQALHDIEEATHDVPWTELRIEVDRDGQRRVEFETEQPMRLLDDSATDPHWDQVHDYLELNRAEVDALVERLRASGDLPGEAAPAASRRGVLGYFRRDR